MSASLSPAPWDGTTVPSRPVANHRLPLALKYVWGMSDTAAQTWMPPYAWFGLLGVGLPLALCGPTHLALRAVMPAAIRR